MTFLGGLGDLVGTKLETSKKKETTLFLYPTIFLQVMGRLSGGSTSPPRKEMKPTYPELGRTTIKKRNNLLPSHF